MSLALRREAFGQSFVIPVAVGSFGLLRLATYAYDDHSRYRFPRRNQRRSRLRYRFSCRNQRRSRLRYRLPRRNQRRSRRRQRCSRLRLCPVVVCADFPGICPHSTITLNTLGYYWINFSPFIWDNSTQRVKPCKIAFTIFPPDLPSFPFSL